MHSTPKLCGFVIIGAHGASVTPSWCQDSAL